MPQAPVPKTGQRTSFGNRDDGELERAAAWPNPRFTDNGDGTVTDNLTGLIWLKNVNCFETMDWDGALAAANGLAAGNCGLTDGSVAEDWCLPNVRELQSLVHYGLFSPVVPDTAGTGQWSEGDPFSGVQSAVYWSSTTVVGNTDAAWGVGMLDGNVSPGGKTDARRVWPVRGGQ